MNYGDMRRSQGYSNMRTMRFILVAASIAMSADAAHAAQILLSESSVVGSTKSLDYAGIDYNAGHIFDHQVGAIQKEQSLSDGTYWLNADAPGQVYITVDLGEAFSNLKFSLFNTHNGPYFNRGTGEFEIVASNTLVADGVNGFTLGADAKTLVHGTLDPIVNGPGAFILGQDFSSADAGSYRYIQFRPLGTTPNPFTPYAYGLNEMRVFQGAAGSVPEPTSWAMMVGGFGLLGGALRRRSTRMDAVRVTA